MASFSALVLLLRAENAYRLPLPLCYRTHKATRHIRKTRRDVARPPATCAGTSSVCGHVRYVYSTAVYFILPSYNTITPGPRTHDLRLACGQPLYSLIK